MGGVKNQRQDMKPRRGARSWLWAGCLVLLGVTAGAVAQTAKEVRELLEWGDNDMALEMADKGLEKTPEDAELQFYHALALARTGENDDAIDAFKVLAEKYPDHPEVHNNLAVLYAEQGNYDLARAALETALATHPAYAAAHKNLGDIYSAQAAEAYNRALARDEKRDIPKPQLDLLSDWIDVSAIAVAEKEDAAGDTVKDTKSGEEKAREPGGQTGKAAEKSEFDAPKAGSEPEKAVAEAQPRPEPEKTGTSAEIETSGAEEGTADKPDESAKPGAQKENLTQQAETRSEPRRISTAKVEAGEEKVEEEAGGNEAGKGSDNKEKTEEETDVRKISTRPTVEKAEPEAETEPEAEAEAEAETVAKKSEPDKPPIAPQQAERAARAVEKWADAWRGQDVDAYIAAYADFFRPENGVAHDVWAEQRQDRVGGPEFIRLSLFDLKIRLVGDGRAIATFRQDYQSDTYQDSVNKTLYLERIKGDWRIVREVSD